MLKGGFRTGFTRGSAELMKALELEWEPIAVRHQNYPESGGDSSRKIRVCEAFDVVRREGATINFSKESCICPGGRHFTGLEIMPLDRIAAVWKNAHKAYESMESALDSIRKQPQPVRMGNYVVIAPLSKMEKRPDMVSVFGNPLQADRLLGLLSYKGAEPFTFYPVSNVCSVITNTMAKGKPEINFVSRHGRGFGNWSPGELIIGLPFHDFCEAVRNLPTSGFGSGLSR